VKKAFETAWRVMERRKITFSEMDMEILANVFELSAGNRIWEKK
jgi:hypothetical protein